MGDHQGMNDAQARASTASPPKPRLALTIGVVGHRPNRLPEAAKVSLAVYNILGARVAQLVDNASQAAGQYTVTWNGTDGTGAGLASGVYLYQLRTENSVITKSMILLK